MFYKWFHELCMIDERPEHLNTETYMIFRNIYPQIAIRKDFGFENCNNWFFDQFGYILDGGYNENN